MSYLDQLNEQQKIAALHKDGPLLILAGAGSGKTSTMTCRIAHLVEDGVSPFNILAVTFTNKAAKEMRDRVESLIGDRVNNMWIQTFHSACLRILRAHSDRIGYKSDFVVYDPTDQKTVVKNIMKEKNFDDKKFTPAYFLSIFSDYKNRGLEPKDYLEENGEDFRTKQIYDVYSAYVRTLRKNNAMDFDDLLINTVKVFKDCDDVLLKYQNRFKYIMVDEYQDTNEIQYMFIKLLAQEHNNICVVGDDDQCIYQWRGADIKNILGFEKDFKNTRVIKLEQNYRSYSNILDAAHSVIEHNKKRKDKKLWTSKETGEKLKYYRADDEKDEARYVAQEINHMRSQYQYKDIAILYRTNAQSRTFEEALSRQDIPYRVLGGLRYYDRKEIKDIMGYMRLVQNTSDDLSLVRIINEPKRGIGEKTVEKLKVLANIRGESLFNLLTDEEITAGLPSKAVSSVNSMIRAIVELGEEKENLRVSDIYDGLLVKTGYLAALEQQNTVESEGRIENLLEFKSVIYDYEKDDQNLSLSDFMERVALVADIDNHDANENAVVLMTMHSAKGLEFPVVFIPGMEDGLFPGWRALDKEGGIDEERRLCYVGMTRAKEKLYLVSAKMRTLYGKTDYTRESQFLKEIDRNLIDGDAIYEKKPVGFSAGGGYGMGGPGTDGYSNPTPTKPFDTLKYAKQQVKSSAAGSGCGISLAAGDKVVHAKFGQGMVVSLSGNTVSVMFETVGLKKLAKDIAPIKKI